MAKAYAHPTPKRRPVLVFVFLLCDCRDLPTSASLSFCLCEIGWGGDTSGFFSSLAENQSSLWIGYKIAEDMKKLPCGLFSTQGRWLFPEPAAKGGSRNFSSFPKATQLSLDSSLPLLHVVWSVRPNFPSYQWHDNHENLSFSESFLLKSPSARGLQGACGPSFL